MYQPWSTMQMPHIPPVHYYPYYSQHYSQPTSFPTQPVVPPVAPSMSPFAPPAASPFVPPMSPFPKPPSLLEQFKTKEGTYDITKMMNTMGQAVQVMNQMSGLVKGLTQTFKL